MEAGSAARRSALTRAPSKVAREREVRLGHFALHLRTLLHSLASIAGSIVEGSTSNPSSANRTRRKRSSPFQRQYVVPYAVPTQLFRTPSRMYYPTAFLKLQRGPPGPRARVPSTPTSLAVPRHHYSLALSHLNTNHLGQLARSCSGQQVSTLAVPTRPAPAARFRSQVSLNKPRLAGGGATKAQREPCRAVSMVRRDPVNLRELSCLCLCLATSELTVTARAVLTLRAAPMVAGHSRAS